MHFPNIFIKFSRLFPEKKQFKIFYTLTHPPKKSPIVFLNFYYFFVSRFLVCSVDATTTGAGGGGGGGY